MPELPEVENIRKSLSRFVLNRTIASVYVKTPKVIHTSISVFTKRLNSVKITDIGRRGKNLILTLSNNFFLIIHLRMTGQILLKKSLIEDKHTHLVIKFTGQPLYLIYRDVRKFGYFDVISKRDLDAFLRKLGPDALSIGCVNFRNIIKHHKRRIKSLLLDQHLISGIGNIYCDEMLYRAKIHPQRSSFALKDKEIANLCQNMKIVLKQAIVKGGSSVSNYIRPDASRGGFQRLHRVYRRQGKPCLRGCGKIKRIEVAQRGTYFCPHCQK